MSTETYWTETTRRVGSDDWDGDCIEVQPDADGTGNVEIRYRHADGTFGDRLVIPPACAARLAAAIETCGRELVEAESEQRVIVRASNADF